MHNTNFTHMHNTIPSTSLHKYSLSNLSKVQIEVQSLGYQCHYGEQCLAHLPECPCIGLPTTTPIQTHGSSIANCFEKQHSTTCSPTDAMQATTHKVISSVKGSLDRFSNVSGPHHALRFWPLHLALSPTSFTAGVTTTVVEFHC